MKMRIIEIKGCKTCTEVLLYLERDTEGEEFVKLAAWHETKDGEFIQTAEVYYSKGENNAEMNKRIIDDFSEFSANVFANGMKF